MNRILTIPAIAMFAVVLGLGVLSPAMAAPGNPNSNATVEVCHFFEEEIDEETNAVIDAHWGVLHTSFKGAQNGHVNGHGESVIGDETNPDADPLPTITLDACLEQDSPEPVA